MKQLPDDMLRQFWQDSAKPAPEGFSDFIMQHLPQQVPLPEELKKPLLSPWAIALIAVLLVAAGFLLGSYSGDAPYSGWALSLQQGVANSLGWLSMSPATLTTLAIVAVAVVLLTGLDRFLQRIMQRMH